MTSLALCPVASRNLQGFRTSRLPRGSLTHSSRFQRVQIARATAETDKAESSPATPPSSVSPSLGDKSPSYIKTDAAGVTVIDVVEPRQYVAEGASTSTPLAVAGAALALAGAAAALLFLGTNPVQSQLEAVGPTLSEFIQKFQAELDTPTASTAPTLDLSPAAAPLPEAAPAPEEAVEEPVAAAVAVEELLPVAEVDAEAEDVPVASTAEEAVAAPVVAAVEFPSEREEEAAPAVADAAAEAVSKEEVEDAGAVGVVEPSAESL